MRIALLTLGALAIGLLVFAADEPSELPGAMMSALGLGDDEPALRSAERTVVQVPSAAPAPVTAPGLSETARAAPDDVARAVPDDMARVVPDDMGQVRLSFAPIARDASPAVVNVYAEREVRRRASPFMNDPFFRRFFEDQAAPPRRMQSALGSGVIVSPDGIVITNHHVIEGADAVRIALSDRRELDADIVLRDPRSDLAVLRVREADGPLPSLAFGDPNGLEVGDLVLAIGNPFGIGQTVTSGIVSGLARSSVGITDFQSFIQTDAAINPGNSGGALVDMGGRLVGINTAIFSRSGGSNGIGFAIPIDLVRAVVESADAGGTLRRPYLGATLQPVTPDVASALGLPRPTGALVADVRDGAAAARAGLEAGDVVVAFDDFEILDPAGVDYRLATSRLGETAQITILRGANRLVATLELEPAPETPPRETREIGGNHPLAGVTIANLSPAVAEELSISEESQGNVVVIEVAPQSSAARMGVRRGDVLVGVDRTLLEDTAMAEAATDRPADGWVLTLERGGRLLRSQIGGRRRFGFSF